LRAAESEDRKENKGQQKQSDPKTDTFPEVLRDIDVQNDQDDEIDQRNEH